MNDRYSSQSTPRNNAKIVAPTRDSQGTPSESSGSPDLRTRPLHEEISRAAEELWRRYGCPSGRDEEIWLEAERQLLGADEAIAHVPGGGVATRDLRTSSPAPSGKIVAGKSARKTVSAA